MKKSKEQNMNNYKEQNMNNYNERIEILASETELAMDIVDVDQFIIDSTANKKVDESVKILFKKMRRSIEEEVNNIFTTRFTFENVNESGIMICGKEENIATGKSTLYELFNVFYQNYPNDAFKKSTYMAGRKCALHFSDDFRKILSINGTWNGNNICGVRHYFFSKIFFKKDVFNIVEKSYLPFALSLISFIDCYRKKDE